MNALSKNRCVFEFHTSIFCIIRYFCKNFKNSSRPIVSFQNLLLKTAKNIKYTVKPVFKDHPWEDKIVVVVDRWSLFRGTFMV